MEAKDKKDKKVVQPLDTLIKQKTGLDRRAFSKQYGFSYNTLSSLATGRKGCSLEFAAHLCKKMRCSFKELAHHLSVDINGIPDDCTIDLIDNDQ